MVNNNEMNHIFDEFGELGKRMTEIDFQRIPMEDLMILTMKSQRLMKLIKEINEFEKYLIVKDAILKMK